MTCPVGMFAIGGGTGATDTHDTVEMFAQEEINSGSYSAWTLYFKNTHTNATRETVYPYAVCLRGSQI